MPSESQLIRQSQDMTHNWLAGFTYRCEVSLDRIRALLPPPAIGPAVNPEDIYFH